MRADDIALGFDDAGEFGKRDEFAEGSLGDVEGADYAGSSYGCAYIPQLETNILWGIGNREPYHDRYQ